MRVADVPRMGEIRFDERKPWRSPARAIKPTKR
jgi:hypothetical protein